MTDRLFIGQLQLVEFQNKKPKLRISGLYEENAYFMMISYSSSFLSDYAVCHISWRLDEDFDSSINVTDMDIGKAMCLLLKYCMIGPPLLLSFKSISSIVF